jgi:hypothetical protein
MDGGYALKLPVEAIAEFRILTQSAPPEYGGTGGATTSVVTRSGGNQVHGSLYEFLRNNAFDARNYFSEDVEPLRQNQFGGTLGGPVVRNRLLLFGYYEGFRNEQGYTTTATVPTALQRTGDFSELGTPLVNVAAGGVPFPGNRLPPAALNPVALNVLAMYPLGNVSPSLYRETVLINNVSDQAGARIDFNASSASRFFGRYSYSGGHNINPVSVRGTDVPGFPTRDDLSTHMVAASNTHILSPSLTNSLHASYLRHEFLFDQRLNRTPPGALGFGYDSSNDFGQGPPFFNLSGYSPIGGAITGPRNTQQGTFEVQDTVAWANEAHLIKLGGELRRTSIDFVQGIAPNAFFVFAGTFPTNNAVANLLLGAPVVFYQGLGDFERGIRLWGASAFAQDEWRVSPRLTLNYGLRYERINPFTEVEDRLNAFVPGAQSQVRPEAPAGVLFPGDPGIPRGIAESVHAFMPRAGMAWDATGEGTWAVKASYGLFYDQFQNGAGTSSQVAVSATPWAHFVQYSGAGLNFQNPFLGREFPAEETFARPSTQFVLDVDAKPPRIQQWNVGLERSLFDTYLVEVRYVGAAATHLPRNVEANPAVYGPGATAQNADRRRIYANCPEDGGPCDFSTIAMLRSVRRRAVQRVAPVRRRGGLQRVVLAVEVDGPPVGNEPVGSCGQAPGRRERPRARPVRPGGGVGPLALRRPPPPRRQCELDASGAGWRLRRGARAARRLADQRDRHVQLRQPLHRIGLGQHRPSGQQPADLGLPGEPPEPRGRPQRRSAHGGRMDQPVGVRAPEPADAGRAVRQRRAQHRARARLRERGHVVGPRGRPCRQREPPAPGRDLQRLQPCQSRPARGGSELAELRAHPVGRSTPADAVRRAAVLLRARPCGAGRHSAGSVPASPAPFGTASTARNARPV